VTEQFIREGAVEYAGKHISLPKTHFSVRLQQPRPAIYVAGLAGDPETQARSARNGYVPFFTTGWSTLEEIRKTRDKAAAAYSAAGGKAEAAPYAAQRYVFVTDDREEALRAAEGARYIRRIVHVDAQPVRAVHGAWLEEIPAPDEPPLETIADRLLVGDPERCAEKLIEEIAELRPTHLSCFMPSRIERSAYCGAWSASAPRSCRASRSISAVSIEWAHPSLERPAAAAAA